MSLRWWLEANKHLSPWSDPGAIGKRIDNDLDGFDHDQHPVSKGVGVMAWHGDLAEGYIQGQIGIGVYIHAALPSVDTKFGDFAFVFQHEKVIADEELGQPRALGDNKQGLNVRRPRRDYVQFSVPVLPRPVIEHSEASIPVSNEQIIGEFR